MSYCTEEQVRNSDKKFADTNDVLQTVIEDRIAQAENIIKVDLSSIISEAELDSIGSTSKIINLLAIYKSVELTLIIYYGVSRKVDELTDVQYFKKEYNDLLKKVLEGIIKITIGTTDYTPKNYPSLDTGLNKKFYVKKGIDGFLPEGEVAYGDTIVEDSIKN